MFGVSRSDPPAAVPCGPDRGIPQRFTRDARPAASAFSDTIGACNGTPRVTQRQTSPGHRHTAVNGTTWFGLDDELRRAAAGIVTHLKAAPNEPQTMRSGRLLARQHERSS